jgi:hypothetical protein
MKVCEATKMLHVRSVTSNVNNGAGRCNVDYQRGCISPVQRGYSPQRLGRRFGENIEILLRTWVTITAWLSFHWSPFFSCFVYNNPEVICMHPNNMRHCNKYLCIVLHTQNTTVLQTDFFELECFNHRSQAKDSRLSATQGTAKVNCILHSHCIYLILWLWESQFSDEVPNKHACNLPVVLDASSRYRYMLSLKEILCGVTQHFWESSKTLRDHATDISFHTFQFNTLFSLHMSL